MSQRIEVGESPLIEIERCGGSLEVRGAIGTTMTLTGDDMRFTAAPETKTIYLESPGDCKLRIPEGASLSIGHVGGEVLIKRIRGLARVDSVGGDCTVRSVGSVEIGRVSGSLHVKYTDGAITIGSVGGSVALRGVCGPIRAESASGDFYALDIESGAEIGRIGGDLSIRTDFQGAAHYRFGRIIGDATFRPGSNASVRFIAPAGAELVTTGGSAPVIEGENTVVTFGEGSSEVVVEDMDGDLRITSSGGAGIYIEGEDLDEHLAKIAVEIDAKLEESLSGVPFVDGDAIRDRVRRKIDHARRRATTGHHSIHFNVGHSPHHADRHPPRDWSPASEEERRAILQMVEEGKISVEEAEKLLNALEGEGV